MVRALAVLHSTSAKARSQRAASTSESRTRPVDVERCASFVRAIALVIARARENRTFAAPSARADRE
jgi:phosphoribosylaminoimidazole carboxylase (NCAIR synthetase)